MCDTIVVVRPDGVLFAKNSDRDPNEAQVLEWHPAADHPNGAVVSATHIEIPQVRHTYATLLSRPFWMWGAEIGANEHGVTIGNEAVFTDQPYAKTGLTGMDLLRLALERSTTAEQATSVIVDLLERYGQGGGCGLEHPGFTYHNSFLIADRVEAYVLETAGTLWASERVASGARSISNGLTIPGFADEHSDFLKTRVSACRVRRPLTEARAGQASGPGDLMRLLRDHGGVAPRYALLNGAMAAPCMHGGGVATGSQTAASWVADLAEDRHWVTATAAPCTGLFKPLRIDEPVDHGPVPTDRFDPATLWWRHERLHRSALRDPTATFPTFVPERDATETAWLAAPPGGSEAFAEADRLLDGWIERLPVVPDRRPPYVRHYWKVRNRTAGINLAAPVQA